jgi:ribosomal protein S27AE
MTSTAAQRMYESYLIRQAATGHRLSEEQYIKWLCCFKLNLAIRLGQMIRKPCIRCGDPKTHGHHTDYSRPYRVMWLCGVCHRQEHTELNEISNYYAA